MSFDELMRLYNVEPDSREYWLCVIHWASLKLARKP